MQNSAMTSSGNTFGQVYLLLLLLILAAGISSRGLAHLSLRSCQICLQLGIVCFQTGTALHKAALPKLCQIAAHTHAMQIT